MNSQAVKDKPGLYFGGVNLGLTQARIGVLSFLNLTFSQMLVSLPVKIQSFKTWPQEFPSREIDACAHMLT